VPRTRPHHADALPAELVTACRAIVPLPAISAPCAFAAAHVGFAGHGGVAAADAPRALMSTLCLGMLEMHSGDVARERELLGDALARAEVVDDLPAMAGVQTNRGLVEERRGNLERAERLLGRRKRAMAGPAPAALRGLALIALHDVRERLDDGAGAQRALDAARARLADSQDRAAERYPAAKVGARRLQRPCP
jgi:hypothetical protein